MALVSEVIDGLKIFLKHGDKHYVAAEHDVIYAGTPGVAESLTAEERTTLEKLGWHFDEEIGSWACFV
jgi:hypothetical protein